MSEREYHEAELEVRTYSISSPDMLEAMIEYTGILEKVSRGEINVSEAKALYVEKILPMMKELEQKYAPREVKPKAQKKKTKKKKTKS